MALTGPAIINAGLGWDLGCRHVREKGRAGQGEGQRGGAGPAAGGRLRCPGVRFRLMGGVWDGKAILIRGAFWRALRAAGGVCGLGVGRNIIEYVHIVYVVLGDERPAS